VGSAGHAGCVAFWRNLDRLTRYYGPLVPGRLEVFRGRTFPILPKARKGFVPPVIECIGPAGGTVRFDDLEDRVNDSQ